MDASTFATLDPDAAHLGETLNFVDGEWTRPARMRDVPDPLTGQTLVAVADTSRAELAPVAGQLRACPKHGMHNPLLRPERYQVLAEVSRRAADAMAEPSVEAFFARLIQRVMPKSTAQCLGEVRVTQRFLANFSGDQVRFLARGFSVPGDHLGQESRGYRWPYGPVAIVAPFNFPLEIPALQVMGALFMGNFPVVKVDSKVAVVFEQFVRLLLDCGLPPDALALVHCEGEVMGSFIEENADCLRLVQFTGSSRVAELVSQTMRGRVRIEDAGFDWKVLGPDVQPDAVEYVAWQCDQDAYAAGGQKCSAQSVCFVHEAWSESKLFEIMHRLADRRSLEDLTISPVITWDNARIAAHIDAVLALPGATLLWGGAPLENHTIPAEYGAYAPTAIAVPLATVSEHFELVTTELFGPFQILVTYRDEDLDTVLAFLERMDQHLTAAVVSSDPVFLHRVLGATVNGTTYAGLRARTTGAPQNHFFGPAGDPRGAGIGTPEAIINTWSCHREIISDAGPVPRGWTLPPAS